MKSRLPGRSQITKKECERLSKNISEAFKHPVLLPIKQIPSYKDRGPKSERLAVYCVACKMWFDTKKGWQAKQAICPSCPACGAPLMQMAYKEFIAENKKQGRLDEVRTWEYPDGEYWKGDDNDG